MTPMIDLVIETHISLNFVIFKALRNRQHLSIDVKLSSLFKPYPDFLKYLWILEKYTKKKRHLPFVYQKIYRNYLKTVGRYRNFRLRRLSGYTHW